MDWVQRRKESVVNGSNAVQKQSTRLERKEGNPLLLRREPATIDPEVTLDLSGELSRQANVIGLTERDLAIAVRIRPFVERHIFEIVDRFYGAIGRESALMQKIEEHSSIDRLRQTLQAHVLEMLSGRIDANYIARRQQVARTHLRIRLAAKWYIGSFAELERAILDVCERYMRQREMTAVRDAIRRLLSIEKQIVLEAFEEASDAVKRDMEAMKRKVSEQVSANASDLAAFTQESTASIEELAAHSREIVQFARSVAEIAGRVEQSATDGMNQLQEQLVRLKAIQSDVQGIGDRIDPLRASAERVGLIADMVREIAESTDLLALNAAIQAAHAGDSGRGFAVVAGEIKKLANQIRGMAVEAADVIRSVREEIKAVSTAVPGISDGVDASSESMTKTNGFFGSLVSEMGTISMKTEEIESELVESSSALEEVSKSIAQVAKAAEGLNALTKQL